MISDPPDSGVPNEEFDLRPLVAARLKWIPRTRLLAEVGVVALTALVVWGSVRGVLLHADLVGVALVDGFLAIPIGIILLMIRSMRPDAVSVRVDAGGAVFRLADGSSVAYSWVPGTGELTLRRQWWQDTLTGPPRIRYVAVPPVTRYLFLTEPAFDAILASAQRSGRSVEAKDRMPASEPRPRDWTIRGIVVRRERAPETRPS